MYVDRLNEPQLWIHCEYDQSGSDLSEHAYTRNRRHESVDQRDSDEQYPDESTHGFRNSDCDDDSRCCERAQSA